MMSGLEINTTFVSYIKTSMYLTGMSREELMAHMQPDAYIGRCPQQVEEFLNNDVAAALAPFAQDLNREATALKV